MELTFVSGIAGDGFKFSPKQVVDTEAADFPFSEEDVQRMLERGICRMTDPAEEAERQAARDKQAKAEAEQQRKLKEKAEKAAAAEADKETAAAKQASKESAAK